MPRSAQVGLEDSIAATLGMLYERKERGTTLIRVLEDYRRFKATHKPMPPRLPARELRAGSGVTERTGAIAPAPRGARAGHSIYRSLLRYTSFCLRPTTNTPQRNFSVLLLLRRLLAANLSKRFLRRKPSCPLEPAWRRPPGSGGYRLKFTICSC